MISFKKKLIGNKDVEIDGPVLIWPWGTTVPRDFATTSRRAKPAQIRVMESNPIIVHATGRQLGMGWSSMTLSRGRFMRSYLSQKAFYSVTVLEAYLFQRPSGSNPE